MEGILGKGPKQTQTNTFSQITPQATQATTNLQGMVNQGTDPSIPYHYAQQREDVNQSFQSPLGAYTTPAVRDAANRVTSERLGMEEAQATQASKFLGDQAAFDRQAAVAGFTQPQIVNSGGTSQSSPGWGQSVSGAAQFGMGLL